MFVELQGVSHSFGRKKVLSNIGLSISEKEIFGLIGPSGAGKTTLIRLIIGAMKADSGTVSVGGRKMPDLKALSGIGYMPQNDALYPDLSAYDNLRFFGGMYGMKPGEIKTRSHELLELLGLSPDAGRKVEEYSGGMKKRLSLAVALLHNPAMLVLDEPTVGIDPVLRRKIWEEFERLKEEGKTILVTTHVMDEAVKCDRLGLIYGGGIIACDTVGALLKRSKNNSIEDLFFESEGTAQ